MCIRDSHRYDFIGFREHTDEEEIQAEKEYERCKAEYDKEKKELDKLYDCLLYTSRCV